MTDHTTEAEAPELSAWDAAWAEYAPEAQTEVVRGVRVTLPTDVPLAMAQHIEQLQGDRSQALARLPELIGNLFGPDVYEGWVRNGMGATELLAAVVWGLSIMRGHPISPAEAIRRVRQAAPDADADDGDAGGAGGKAPAVAPTTTGP